MTQKDKEQINLPHFTFDDVLALQCCMETVKKVQEDKDLYEKLKDLHGRVYDAYHLEKQGENTENNDWINQKESTDTCDSSVIKDKKFPAGEKRDFGYFSESDNKVEPKFKVGDFIVNDYCRGRVVELTDDAYLLDTGQGIPFSCEHNAHLWTIADAKDGDVLSYRDGQWIFIYKKQVDDNSFHYYSLYSTIHQDLTIDDSAFTLLGDAIIPATKEQRDILFTKMREAGYKWNPEKKELGLLITNGGDFFESENCEQKPSWSEEDEDDLNNIIWLCNNCINGSEITWIPSQAIRIKSLIERIKDTIFLQSKQEWSEEDENNINSIVSRLEVDISYWESRSKTRTNEDEKLINWLKSLRPQKHWKPSNENMYYLNWIANIKLGDSVVEREVSKHLNELYNDLKKL